MPTCTECVVVVALLATLLSLALRGYNKWQERRWYEDRIRAFDPKEAASLTLPPKRVVRNGSLSGRWTMVGRRYRSTLIFRQTQERDESHYQTEFATHMCTRSYSSDGTAEFREGRVFLGKPVAESHGPVYQQLYCVHVGGRRVLIPMGKLDDTEELLDAIHKAETENEWLGLQSMAYLYDASNVRD